MSMKCWSISLVLALMLSLPTSSLADIDDEALQAQLRDAQARLAEAAAEVARLSSEAGLGGLQRRLIAGGPRLGIVLGSDEEGVFIEALTPGGPAQEAGLQRGDRLVAIDGLTIMTNGDSAVGQVREVVSGLEADVPVAVEVRRDGELLELDVAPRAGARISVMRSIAELGDMDFDGMTEHFEGMREAGRIAMISSADMSEQIAKLMEERDFDFKAFENLEKWREWEPASRLLAFGGPGGLLGSGLMPQLAQNSSELGTYFGTEQGLLVLKPDPRHDLGLRAGDVLLSVNGVTLSRPGDFHRAVAEVEPGGDLELQVMREGRAETLFAEMPHTEAPGRSRRVRVLHRPDAAI